MPELVTPSNLLLLCAAFGYLLGSIPFGILVSKAMGLGDPRRQGSGNIGATNVLRSGSKKAAALTLVLDGGKAALAVVLARTFVEEDGAQLAGLAAFLGHCFPVWLGFRGGKGVATFLGLMLVLSWKVGLLCCAAWLVGVAITRISSMGALCAASISSIAAVFLGHGHMAFLAFLLTILVFVRHRENIARLRANTEPRINVSRRPGSNG